MFRIILFILSVCLSTFSFGQKVTGSWYGKADVMVRGNTSNYLTELVLKQKGDEVEGIFGYYFKDSYQSFFIRGTYNIKSREVHIKNLPMLFYGSATRDGIECPMNFRGIFMVSQLNSTIKGSFYTNDQYKYTCPELRVKLMMDTSEKDQDNVLKTGVAGKKFWKPQEEDFVFNNVETKSPVKLPADLTVVNNNIPVNLNEDSLKELVRNFENRKNTYNKDIEIESDSIKISFYDNGDIDGDSISVFLNKRPILVKQELTSRALNIYLSLDTLKGVNEISMFAENLGKYPPNTALMLITDGIKTHEFYLSSSLTQNASIRMKRKNMSSKK